MKTAHRLIAFALVLSTLFSIGGAQASATSILNLPGQTTHIEESAFHGDTSLDEVVFNEGLESIGKNAFLGSTIKHAYIPDTVTSIGEGAFAYCYSLSAASVPEGITIIEPYTFYYSYYLKSIALPESLISIGESAFGYCYSLNTVSVPRKVTTIGDFAFYENYNLESIDLPKSLTLIGENAFYGCTNLQFIYYEGTEEEWNAITVADGNELLQQVQVAFEQAYDNKYKGACGDNVTWELKNGTIFISGYGDMYDYGDFNSYNETPWRFYDSLIQSVVIEDGVTRIGDYAFCLCQNVSSVSLPESLLSIGIGAFYQCETLTKIDLPDSIVSLGERAFYECSLTEINYPRSWQTVEPDPSEDNSDTVYNAHCSPFFETDVKSVSIPDGITSIPDFAFSNMESLENVTFPTTLQSIGRDAFSSTSLKQISIVAPNLSVISQGAFLLCHSLTEFTVIGNLETIGNLAFKECENLENVVLPDSVADLGNAAFAGCTSLLSIEIPDAFVGESYETFQDSALQTVILPAGLERVDFLEEAPLHTIYYCGTEEMWELICSNAAETNPVLNAEVFFEYGPAITLSAQEGTVSSENQTFSVAVYAASSGWAVNSDSDWVTVMGGTRASGSNTVQMEIAENTESVTRSAVLSFSLGTETESFTLYQLGQQSQSGALSVSEASWFVTSYNAEIKTVTVYSDASWALTEYPEWIIPSMINGENGDSLSLRCDFNANDASRNGTMTFVSGPDSVQISVWQPGTIAYPCILETIFPDGTARVGEEQSITVITRNADEVQLVVDDVKYEKYPVYNDTATIKRVFHSGGNRSVQFIPFCNGASGISSAEKLFTINKDGDLAAPVIHPVSEVLCGNELILSWDEVDFASEYAVYFSNGRVYKKLGNTSALSFRIEPGLMMEPGNYAAEVIATGAGMSQASASLEFTVSVPTVDFRIISPTVSGPYEAHDTMYFTITNPNNRHVRLRITDGKHVWYLPETQTVNSTEPILTFEPPAAGDYTASVVAYSTSGILDDEEFWGESTTFSFTASAGELESVLIENGNKYLPSETPMLFKARGKKTLQTVSIYHNNEQTPFLVLHAAEDDSDVDSSSRRTMSELYESGFSEGHHTFRFVGIDKDNVTSSREVDCYLYTDNSDSAFTRFPINNTVYVREKPDSVTTRDTLLPISQEVRVLGTYDNNQYFVEVHLPRKTVRGFVPVNQLSEVQLADLSQYHIGGMFATNGLELIDLRTPYQITLKWIKWNNLPSNGAYNAYLVCNDTNAKVKLNDNYLKTESVTFSSVKLRQLLSQEWVKTYLQVDLVDTSTGIVAESVSHPNDDAYTIFVYKQCKEEELLQRVNLAVQGYTGVHDILRYGSYTYDGKQYTGPSVQDLMVDGTLYSIITGDANDLNLDDATRGALMADCIMNMLSENAPDVFMLEDLEPLLDAIGLRIDFNKFIKDNNLSKTKKLHMDNLADRSAFKNYLNAGKSQFDAAKWKEAFDTIEKYADLVIRIEQIVVDYIKFRSVTRADVQMYINTFRNSKDYSLRFCAWALGAMTSGDVGLGGYLGAAYGSEYAMEKLGDFAYESITTVLPPEWKYTIKAASLFNDFSLNTSKMLEAAYDLEAVTAMTQESCNSFRKAFNTFRANPTEASYQNLMKSREVYAGLMICELNKFNEFAKEANSGVWAILCNAVMRKEVPQQDVDCVAQTMASTFESSMEACYTRIIRPFA